MSMRDGGLASEYWKQYYDADEVEEIIEHSETTMFVTGNYPVHVRMYRQPHPAPTVVMAHGMLVYGLILARIQLPFFRAGFNVVQFDIPGLGQSGGPRAGCTIDDVFNAWKDALNFTHATFGEPMYAMGVAEDGVTCYYATASDPRVRAISVHTLFQYGDPEGVDWAGEPWLVTLKKYGLAVGSAVRPTASIKGTAGIPWDGVFGAADDGPTIRILEGDPLALQRTAFSFMYSLIKPQEPPVPFEQCRTPVQVIASDQNRIWPYDMVHRYYERLGGPKEFITLYGKPQWEFNREFHETYCAHVIRWFAQQGAEIAVKDGMVRSDVGAT